MKKLLTLSLSALIVFSTFGQTKPAAPAKTTLSELFIYDVILFDTAKAENVGKNYEGVPISHYNESVEYRYLNTTQSRLLRNEMRELLKRKDLIFWDGFDQKTREWAAGKTVIEITIAEEDSLGNALGTKTVSDTIDSRSWNRITFFEEWTLNKKTGIIEKNVLGYYFNWYNKDKMLWIPMFGIVRDKKALLKIQKFTAY